MPAVPSMALLGYSSPGPPASAEEARWKRTWLAKAQAIPTVDTLWVHKSIVEQANALMLVLQTNGAHLGRVTDDWGFANRNIRNAASSSYHRWGKAFDLEATENPQFALQAHGFGATTTQIKRACRLLGFTWGLTFNTRWRDPMHFESHVSRARARYITSRLVKPTRRSRELAQMCDMPVREFCRRVQLQRPYPGG